MVSPTETWFQSLGREDPLEKETGNPFQWSCLGNPMDREAWWATVHEVEKSRMQLSTHTARNSESEVLQYTVFLKE